MAGSRRWGQGWGSVLSGHRASVWDSGGAPGPMVGLAAQCECLMLLSYMLKNGKNGKFYAFFTDQMASDLIIYVFYHNVF